ncbi:hypothetical protein RF11_09081 [Thelohanellus kitauei]|uniref:Uncharacterized protein n=1 Tax=Thelohanellus kitauei TaxID=669202 RepID=A0A0C2IR39_THEKT|nr:hypothetical protein RF11_09081 [Thelohanellus kitauei]
MVGKVSSVSLIRVFILISLSSVVYHCVCSRIGQCPQETLNELKKAVKDINEHNIPFEKILEGLVDGGVSLERSLYYFAVYNYGVLSSMHLGWMGNFLTQGRLIRHICGPMKKIRSASKIKGAHCSKLSQEIHNCIVLHHVILTMIIKANLKLNPVSMKNVALIAISLAGLAKHLIK